MSIRFYARISPYIGILAMGRLGTYPNRTCTGKITRAYLGTLLKVKTG
ncbi:MAG: hypothetical protein KGZ45_08585 [Clostridium sp.]|nr:hypothetical protein [Clostridium sp.]